MRASDTADRLIKVFGKREVELLAAYLFDEQLLETPVEEARLPATQADPYLRDGWRIALEWRWLLPAEGRPGFYLATPAFRARILNALARPIDDDGRLEAERSL